MPRLLSDIKEPINILYYGDGGTGKTTDMMAMANLGRIWAINAESGIKARALRNRGIDIGNIEIYPDPLSGEKITYDGIEKEWLRIREELEGDPNAYVGVVWDSATEIHKLLLDDITAKAVEKAYRQGKERDKHFIALDDYGVMTEQVRSLMRKFRDLPCHFAVSALQRRDKDDDGSIVYTPAITPKLGVDLVGWMDLICHTSVVLTEDGDEEFRGLTRPHGKFRGKDRLDALPKWLAAPTFDRVAAYVDGDLNADTDPVQTAARERQRRATAAAAVSAVDTESNEDTNTKEEVTA